jgi:glycosyltransferase involved in cell wall biosynthesis
MKIALVTGSFPRGQCGVGDYVDLLAEALNTRGIDAHVIDSGDFRLRKSVGLHRALRDQHFDLIQLHYPSLGFGTNLGPQAIAILRRCVITLHEGSQSHFLRKLALVPFSFRPGHVIFFSNFERQFGLKWAPWLARVSSVIPPPSNIRKVPYQGERNLGEVVSFGLIRPRNGHDSLLEFAALLKFSDLGLRLRIVGSPQSAKFMAYFQDLQRRSEGLPVIWDHSLSEQQVAERLAKSCLAYLPYPDGAAELRSTLKSALLNGLAIITTRGAQTPSTLEGVVKFVQTPQQALETAGHLLNNPAERERLAHAAMHYVRDWTWERTAELHAAIYRNMLSTNGAGMRKPTSLASQAEPE